MSDLAPLVPADCDLRGYEFMPLYGTHLFGSEFNARATDEAWRAALTLWWAAWNQCPAASLPNDDIALCRLADLGRDMKRWAKIKGDALHGFVECTDGRLYHRFLAPLAIEAWERRCHDRERKAGWRAKKQTAATGTNADVPVAETGTGRGQRRGRNADVPAERRGEERTGEGEGGAAPATPTPRPIDSLAKALRRRGMSTGPLALAEWSDFLQGSCRIKSTDEAPRALDLIIEAAKREGVYVMFSKHAARFADEVAGRLKAERKAP
jgi:hypothetical protein